MISQFLLLEMHPMEVAKTCAILLTRMFIEVLIEKWEKNVRKPKCPIIGNGFKNYDSSKKNNQIL